MLDIAAIREHLTRISYKPGWKLTAYEGQWEGHHLVVTAPVENSYQPGTTVDLGVHCPLPPMATTVELERWLAWRIGRIESHEMREWLKRDGEAIFDPHAPGAHEDRPESHCGSVSGRLVGS